MGHILSEPAEEDYLQLYIEGVALFGRRQAEAYLDRLDRVLDLIGDNPLLGAVRGHLPGAPRSHLAGSHVILWDVAPDGTAFILRIRHQREDWQG
ncbi:type II toxin-antitoxin system RelE/ParE family toxin [Paracoccus luteus]|uniref:type II toxin-antitoxin system RelE/ParE family toxin n=1 Tax=Paracoccus luteus TaxID=2508543 RepID=UPI0010700C4B|nr:type II toxin-antitoxin system RelE/ParE family toxin [Paracoccus luteus]